MLHRKPAGGNARDIENREMFWGRTHILPVIHLHVKKPDAERRFCVRFLHFSDHLCSGPSGAQILKYAHAAYQQQSRRVGGGIRDHHAQSARCQQQPE